MIKNVEFNVTPQERVKLFLDDEQFGQELMLKYFARDSVYEPETFLLFKRLLKEGDTFIDIGGHVGFFSIVSSALVGVSGRVYTFEPEPKNYLHLLQHIQVNNLRNITPHCWAVGDQSKMVVFNQNQDCDGGHSLWDCGKFGNNVKSRENPVRIATYMASLDVELAGRDLSKLRLVKVDVEGAEELALRGMEQILKTHQPFVVAEIHEFGLHQMGSSGQALRKYMESLGYITYLLEKEEPESLVGKPLPNKEFVYNVLFAAKDLP